MKQRSSTPLFETYLFLNNKERAIVFALIVSVFIINLSYRYSSFLEFKSNKYYEDSGRVELQYKKFSQKRDREYTVLKIKSDSGFVYYITSWDELKDIRNQAVSVGIITDKISFKEYLSSFFAISFRLSLKPSTQDLRGGLLSHIDSIHANQSAKEIFGALFLADSISKELRDQITKWGIAHLFALSGFHLALLGGLLFFILYHPYLWLQKRYFRYRNRNFDLFIATSAILFFYLLLTHSPPSLLRSFVMLFVGGVLYFWHVKVFSFEFLGWLLLLILALFPQLFFSIGFWLSFGGVFYIYLFLRYFKDLNKFAMLFWLNIYLYIAMVPFAHLFFGIYSPFALLSPLVSILFAFFYIAELALHFVGFGALLDRYVEMFIYLPSRFIDFRISSLLFGVYAVVSLGAMFYRGLFYVQVVLGAAFLLLLNVIYLMPEKSLETLPSFVGILG